MQYINLCSGLYIKKLWLVQEDKNDILVDQRVKIWISPCKWINMGITEGSVRTNMHLTSLSKFQVKKKPTILLQGLSIGKPNRRKLRGS